MIRLALLLCLPAAAAANSVDVRAELAELRRLLAAEKATIASLEGEMHSMKDEDARRLSDVATSADVADLGDAVTHAWLILCGALVMFMHAGFAMLETGSCRAKNVSNVLLKNLVNVCAGTIAWWIFGWAFAYGGPDETGAEGGGPDGFLDNGFIGTKQFAAGGFFETDDAGNQTPAGGMALGWFFQWAFCTAAATIVSGGVAERVQSPTYAVYAFFMAAFIYPVVVAWTWGYGWIMKMSDVGVIDFAGSGIVHLTGGVSALAGTVVLGPRKGRFENPDEFAPHSLPLVVLGTLALWFGWYGFNCGSTLGMSDSGTGELAAHVAMNTTLSAACGGIVTFILAYAITRMYDVGALCNGILAGLVSITAPCGNVESGSAVAIGIFGGFVYTGASMLLKKLKIDDPVDASPVHGACGIWGVIAAGLFDMGNGFDTFHGWSGFSCMTEEDADGNTVCQTGIWGKAFGVQILLCIMVCLWAGTLSTLIFLGLKMTGLLRISDEVEEVGLDAAKHSPAKAYSLTGGGATEKWAEKTPGPV